MVRTLITGGTGFIGSHLVRDCLRRGDEVSVIARPDSDTWRLDGALDEVALHRVEPRDAVGLRAALDQVRPQRVFLLAAATRFNNGDGLRNMDRAMRANVEPLRIMLDEIARLSDPPQAVVRAGSLAEIDTDQNEPASLYGLSVLMGTHLQRIWRDWTGIPAVTARLSLTYGGDQSRSFFIPGAISDALSANPVPPRQPGALRDLLHVDDVVAALQLIADHAADLPPSVNVSTGAPHRLGDLAMMIAEMTGHAMLVEDMSEGTGNIVSCPPSPELLALGWAPTVPLKRGLEQVLDWESDRAATNSKRHAQ